MLGRPDLVQGLGVLRVRAVDLPLGSLIGSTRRMGNGFRVEGCDFGFNRSRGILIKASDGVVVNNRLTANWGEAIKVSPEYWWLESGSSSNVEIRGNTVADCRSVGIAVYAHNGRGELAPSGAHSNITVSGNTLTGCPQPNILVTSTTGLHLADNACRPSETAKLSGHALWMFRLDPEKLEPVMALNCAGD